MDADYGDNYKFSCFVLSYARRHFLSADTLLPCDVFFPSVIP